MKFSIITPSFNQLDWLKLCIASVRDQVLLHAPSSTLHASLSIEHIIQDAGTPGIEDLAREFGAEFHRNGQLVFEANPSAIRHPLSDIERKADLKIFSEPDTGMYDAINKGLLKSSGEICAWLNCDEQYIPGALEHIQEAFKADSSADAFFGDFVVLDQGNNPLCYRRGFAQDCKSLVCLPLSIASCSLFFRRKVVDQGFLFDPGWRIIGDKVWIHTLLQAGFRFQPTRRLVACFRLLINSLSSKPLATVEQKKFEKQFKEVGKIHRVTKKIGQVYMKFLSGCYFPRYVDFKISSDNREFIRIGPKWIGFRWPKST